MAKPKKPTYEELAADLRALRRFRRADGTASVVRVLSKWVPLAIIARYAYLAIAALAGQDTKAELLLSVLTEAELKVSLAWAIGGVGVLYGLVQRELRRQVIARYAPYLSQAELALDPARSSSDLTPRGDTPPDDRD
jgi:hypothetical protein